VCVSVFVYVRTRRLCVSVCVSVCEVLCVLVSIFSTARPVSSRTA
jgi:hypothetical protein